MHILQIPPNAKVIKDFRVALKDMEPMVKDPGFLRRGRKIPNFNMLPREAWANWLLCTVYRHLHGETVTFAEDEKGDGILIDQVNGICVPIEHVSALQVPSKRPLPTGDQAVIDAVLKKAARGEEYARGKLLLVFFEGVGKFTRQNIREAIHGKHSFVKVYSVGLLTCDDNGYSYAVTEYNDGHSQTFIVTITPDFDSWTVEQIMA